MSVWVNPLYRIESRGRGPQSARDWRGWLLGRGALAIIVRLLPIVAVVGCAAAARISWPQPVYQTAAQLGFWVLPIFLSSLVVLVGAGVAMGRDWQEDERVQEWVISPMERGSLVGGKVWGWVLPFGAALAAGSVAAAVAWEVGWRAGWGVPIFAPLEGVFLLLEGWATLYLMASVGVWAGNQTRRAWKAIISSLLLGLPLLGAILVGLYYTLDLARLGGHLMVIGGAWLVGSLFHGWSERKLK